MSATFESIYPDFLRTGLDRLHRLGVGRELSALFSALEHFRRDLQEQKEADGILTVTHRYVAGLNLCRTHAFYLVTPPEFGFRLTRCEPSQDVAEVDGIVKAEIRAGRFAWALRQNASVCFESSLADVPAQVVFHSLGVAAHTVGMFCGLLRADPIPAQEITFSLLTMHLGTCADALAAARRTADLTRELKTLSGLLPICAWCKKIRDDTGYWKQLEGYIQLHSEATFTHGVCPECERKLMAAMPSASTDSS